MPAYKTELVLLLKSTSLAATITVVELTGLSKYLVAESYDPFTYFLLAGVLYYFVNGVVLLVARRLESRYDYIVYE